MGNGVTLTGKEYVEQKLAAKTSSSGKKPVVLSDKIIYVASKPRLSASEVEGIKKRYAMRACRVGEKVEFSLKDKSCWCDDCLLGKSDDCKFTAITGTWVPTQIKELDVSSQTAPTLFNFLSSWKRKDEVVLPLLDPSQNATEFTLGLVASKPFVYKKRRGRLQRAKDDDSEDDEDEGIDVSLLAGYPFTMPMEARKTQVVKVWPLTRDAGPNGLYKKATKDAILVDIDVSVILPVDLTPKPKLEFIRAKVVGDHVDVDLFDVSGIETAHGLKLRSVLVVKKAAPRPRQAFGARRAPKPKTLGQDLVESHTLVACESLVVGERVRLKLGGPPLECVQYQQSKSGRGGTWILKTIDDDREPQQLFKTLLNFYKFVPKVQGRPNNGTAEALPLPMRTPLRQKGEKPGGAGKRKK